jgi:hypothetical protein
MAVITKERIPTAITGAFLAALTVLMTLPGVLPEPWAVNFPAWAVFITWAGYFAAGGGGPGKSLPVFKKMYPPLIWGAFWGLMAGVGFYYINPHLDSLEVTLLVDAIIIFLVNQPILWGAKYWKLVSYAPACFYAFATFFATYFGGFGFEPEFLIPAFLSGLFCNFLGPIWGHLQVALSFPKKVEVPDAQVGE